SSASEDGAPADENSKRWRFVPTSPPEPPPIMKSYVALAEVMPKKSTTTQTSSSQHTLQALSDLTGYLTTQIYTPYRAPSSVGNYFNTGSTLSPAEEEF